MKVTVNTIGCKVNQYEAESIKEAFVSCGAKIAGEDEAADIYVVNTCTVTNIADRKSRQFIRRAKKMNPDSVVVVTGCYAQVDAAAVEGMPEVDVVIGNNLKNEIAGKAIELYEAKMASNKSGGKKLSHVLDYDELSEYEDMGIVTSDESSMCRAYIKIEEGCNRFCSYCKIPYARGGVRSRAPEGVVAEARALVGKGYKEIILTGINTALYGSEPGFDFERAADEKNLSGLETIVKRINAIEGDFRIRLSSLEPNVVDVHDVEKLLGYDKLCHHLHLSIQSGSNHVLDLMNRHYSTEEYLEITEALKRFDPLYGITTDIIAGFPGETEDDHKESLALINEAGFGRVHVFKFSPRKGTKAETMEGQLSAEIKAKRAGELSQAADKSFDEFLQLNMNHTHRLLAEEREGGYVAGYTGNYIRTYIKDEKEEIALNEFCDVKIVGKYKDGALADMV